MRLGGEVDLSTTEAIGKPMTMLLPEGRPSEENDILEKIRRGERVEHFETVRIAKDGTRLNISVTISPVRNASGTIVGASKIARDVSVVRAAEAERGMGPPPFDKLRAW